MSEPNAHSSPDAVRPRIVPIVIPHGPCGPGCPLCPPDASDTDELMPTPADIPAAMLRYCASEPAGTPIVLAFYGAPLPALPHDVRAPLLDAAERQVRSGQAAWIRLSCDPGRLLRAPLGEWRVRGVRSVEVTLPSAEHRVMREWGIDRYPVLLREAMSKAKYAMAEVGIQLMPGLPGDSHEGAQRTARFVASLQPSYVRLLPALALQGTRLETWWRDGRWDPMTLEQAVQTCSAMLRIFRDAGIPVARIGLQPQFDLVRGPLVLDGPYHPSLRQLVESRLFRRSIFEQAGRHPFRNEVQVRFHPADESYVRGPMNRTVNELRKRLRFSDVVLLPDPEVERGRPVVEVLR